MLEDEESREGLGDLLLLGIEVGLASHPAWSKRIAAGSTGARQQDGRQGTLAVYALTDDLARRRLRNTNSIEHDHAEMRRRTNVIRISPNEDSFLRLATALVIERNEQWAARCYLAPQEEPKLELTKIA